MLFVACCCCLCCLLALLLAAIVAKGLAAVDVVVLLILPRVVLLLLMIGVLDFRRVKILGTLAFKNSCPRRSTYRGTLFKCLQLVGHVTACYRNWWVVRHIFTRMSKATVCRQLWAAQEQQGQVKIERSQQQQNSREQKESKERDTVHARPKGGNPLWGAI